jgi:Skp family chaperone for outer membrane proteins
MKKIKSSIFAAMAIGAAATLSSFADIGVVDMETLIKMHPRSSTDRAILEQYVKDYQADKDDILASIQKETAVFEDLRKAAEDVSLSEKALEEKRALAKAQIIKIRQLEKKAREMAAGRQKELTSQELHMRQRVVSELRDIVAEIAKKKDLDLVLDSTGLGIGGYSPVIYNAEKYDITDDVIKKMPTEKE